MKYIYTDENDCTRFDRYFDYLKYIKNQLPDELYSFASDIKRYSLDSYSSLHDSWMTTLCVSYSDHNKRNYRKNVNMELLGPYHDRVHQFSYSDVREFRFISPQPIRVGFKDDLLYFEIRYQNGLLEHEILFDNDVELLIICSDIKYEEFLITPDQNTG